MGPRAGLEGCGKSRLHRDSNPELSNPQRIAIPTTLFRSDFNNLQSKIEKQQENVDNYMQYIVE